MTGQSIPKFIADRHYVCPQIALSRFLEIATASASRGPGWF